MLTSIATYITPLLTGMNIRTEEGVAKELTVIPLSTFLYPAAYLQELLCIVIPSGVVLLSAKVKLCEVLSLWYVLLVSFLKCVINMVLPFIYVNGSSR